MDIVCFANDWDGDPLSKKHIMRRLAQRGSRVLWVNSLGNRKPKLADAKDRARAVKKAIRFARSAMRGPRAVEPNLWVVDPIAAPVYGSEWADRLNGALVSLHVRAAAASLGFRTPVHYSFVPQSAWVAGRLNESLLVYHAADEYAAFGGADREAVLRLEKSLLGQTDLYVACSQPLLVNKERLSPGRSLLVRHGVEHAHFARALDPSVEIPAAARALPRPIVGFFGLVAEWVDLDALALTADRLAATGGGTVVVLGEVRGADRDALERLQSRANVVMPGRRPYDELPGWSRAFDCAVLPFVQNELTHAANPLKLREYLAAGLPVVSTDLPEAVALAELANGVVPGSVGLARTGEELAELAVAMARAPGAGPRPERSRAIACESWDAKVTDIHAALERALAAKRGSCRSGESHVHG